MAKKRGKGPRSKVKGGKGAKSSNPSVASSEVSAEEAASAPAKDAVLARTPPLPAIELNENERKTHANMMKLWREALLALEKNLYLRCKEALKLSLVLIMKNLLITSI